MSEFVGLIESVHDAKLEGGVSGALSTHTMTLPHSPDPDAFYAASLEHLGPEKRDHTAAFMFETRFPKQLARYAAELPALHTSYPDVWNPLRNHDDPNRPGWNGA